MACTNKWGKDVAVIVDNAAGSTTRITAWTNQAGIQGATDILDETGFCAYHRQSKADGRSR